MVQLELLQWVERRHSLLYFARNRGKFLGKQLQYFLLAIAAMNDINGLRDRCKSRSV
jgi:hypothetical protein